MVLSFSGIREGPCSNTISVTFGTIILAIASFAEDLGFVIVASCAI